MQSINIQLENETGVATEKTDLNFTPVILELRNCNNWKVEYPFLTGIDPYGNTIFNVHQIPYVEAELKKLSNSLTDEETKGLIERVCNLIKKIEQHDYIRFIGD